MNHKLRNLAKKAGTFLVISGMAIQTIFSSYSFGLVNAYATGYDMKTDSIPISVGQTTEAVILSPGDVEYFSFTPTETNIYNFESLGDDDTYGYLYDKDGEQITSNDDGGENRNFKISTVLTAGETYYFCAKYLDSDTAGSFNVTLSKSEEFNVFIKGHENESDYIYYYTTPESNINIEPIVVNKGNKNLEFHWYNYDDIDETASTFSRNSIDTNIYLTLDVKDKSTDNVIKSFSIGVIMENNFEAWASESGEDKSSYYETKIAKGTTTTLKVVASADNLSKLTYKWYNNDGDLINGATTDTITTGAINGATNYTCEVNDGFGSYTTIYYTVGVENHFTATADKDTVTVAPYGSATLKVNVSCDDSSKLKYQWRTDGYEDINGATSSTYTVNNVTDNEYYTCVVDDGYDNVIYVYFTVELDNEFNAYVKDSDEKDDYAYIYVKPNTEFTLSVATEGIYLNNVSYEWYDGNGKLDCTTSDLTIDGISKSSHYYCYVNDGFLNGETINFYVYIDNSFKANITGLDEDVTETEYSVIPGNTKTLSITATADDTSKMTYKWYKNNELVDSLTTSSITTDSINSETYYSCEVDDGYGNSKDFYFTIKVDNGFNAYIYDKKNTTEENKTILIHNNVDLKVATEANDKSKLTYKWYDSYDLTSETSDTYTVSDVTKNKTVYCLVEDGYGNSQYIYFYIYVDNDLKVNIKDMTTSYKKFTVPYGESTKLEIEASAIDMSRITYEWRKNDQKIPSATSNSLEIGPLTEAAEYTCTAWDAGNNGITATFVIGIENHLSAYVVGYESAGREITINATPDNYVDLEISASADNMEGLTYTWTESGKEAILSTNSTFTTEKINSVKYYNCMVEDKYNNKIYFSFTIKPENHLSLKPADCYGNMKYITVDYGSSATLDTELSADDTENITLKWYDGYDLIDGANSLSYTTDTITERKDYTCVATDKYGNTAYAYFVIKVNNNLEVHAKDYEDYGNYVYIGIDSGDDVVLNTVVTAYDLEDMTYQWLDNSGNVLAEDTTTYTLTNVTTRTSVEFYAEDKYGNTDTVSFVIGINNHLEAYLTGYENKGSYINVFIDKGSSTTLTIAATADDTDGISYDWSDSDSNLYPDSPSITTAAITDSSKSYYCNVTDKYGNSIYFNITVGIKNELQATLSEYDSIDSEGTYFVSVPYSETATLKVIASANDTEGITYKWCDSDGNDVYGGSTDTLTTPVITKDTMYTCEVTDKFDNSVNVLVRLEIDSDFSVEAATNQNIVIDSGSTATFGVKASTKYPDKVTYKWYENDTLIKGATKDTYTTKALTEKTDYKCVVNDGFNDSTYTFFFTASINANFSAYVKGTNECSADYTINAGESKKLEVEATGEDLEYSWYTLDGTKIDGATSSSYTTGPLNKAVIYVCTVKDKYKNEITIQFSIGIENNLKAYVKGTTASSKTLSANKGNKLSLAVDVTANNTNGIKYTWFEVYKYASNDNYDTMYKDISGEHKDTLNITYPGSSDNFYGYACEVEDAYGNSDEVIFHVVDDGTIIPSVCYKVQVQSFGWEKSYVKDGALSGTVGKAKRLEAIKIKLTDQNGKAIPSSYGSVSYRTHVQKQGWQGYVKDDKLSGTVGRALRLEAISIKLEGEIADEYDIYYKVQAEKLGWLGWAMNGEDSGSAGYGYRLEAIKIQLVEKGKGAPSESDKKPYYDKKAIPTVGYKTQVQTFGWEKKYATNGGTSGTVGKAKRLESIKIKLIDKKNYDGSITYRTHVQRQGWQNYVKDDELSGTVGKALRLEAIQIELTGELAKNFDVYYRVQAQKFGWMGWAKNGEQSGTAGYSYRLEAIQIQLAYKGTPAPGSTANAFKKK